MMDFLQTSDQMWVWANWHPYLFTIIKIGTPSVWLVILYAGNKIRKNFVGGKR